MAAISNVKSDGTLRREKDNDDVIKVLKGNMGWHHDSTYMPVQAKGAVFSAEVVPSDRRPHRLRRHARRLRCARRRPQDEDRGLAAYHSLHYSQSKLGHVAKKTATANTAATASMTGRCRSGRW